MNTDTSQVLIAVGSGHDTQSKIADVLNLPLRQVDAALQRLRKMEAIRFDKPSKRWVIARTVITGEQDPVVPCKTTAVCDRVEQQQVESTTKEIEMNPKAETKPTETEMIDRAIKRAEARKNAKVANAEAPASTPKAPGVPRARLSAEEKQARQSARDAEQATKRAARTSARETKRAERDANKQAPHLAKVAKAASKLPTLDERAQLAFNEATLGLSRDMVSALALHLQHFNRARATERALTQKLTVGDSVRIVGGDSRYVGQTGTVTKAQRIRCYVSVAGAKKDIYLFSSDVEVVSTKAATGTHN